MVCLPRLDRWLGVALAAGLALALAAQDAAPSPAASRGRLPGFVTDNAGRRVPGARVFLVSRPMPARLDLGGEDVIETLTDANGLFRADLQSGRGYTAWALWRDGKGTARRSRFAEGVVPGPPRALEEDEPQVLRRVCINGLAAWEVRAPFRVRAFAIGESQKAFDLVLDAEGRAELPDLSGVCVEIEVRAADGILLRMAQPQLASPRLTEATIDVRAPRRLRVVVRDEKGAAIADATVFQANAYSVGGMPRRIIPDALGITDGSGEVAIEVPGDGLWDEPRSECPLIVTASARARLIVTLDTNKVDTPCAIVLPPAVELRGRLVDPEGEPARGVTLIAEAYGYMQGVERGGMGIHERPLPIASDGVFHFHTLHSGYGFRLLAMMEPARAIELGLAVKPDFGLAPVLWLAVGQPPWRDPHDLGDLKLHRLTVARIEVVRHDGEPVPGARLQVTTRDLYNSPLDYTTDRLGRLQFPLPDGEVRVGAFLRDGGVATELVRVPPQADDPGLSPLRLQLTRPIRVRGMVVDHKEKPIAGAVVYPWNRPEGGDRQLADLAFDAQQPSAPTSSDGAFTVNLPMGDVTAKIRGAISVDGKWAWSPELPLVLEQRDLDGVRLVIDLAETRR